MKKKYIINQAAIQAYLTTPLASTKTAQNHFDKMFTVTTSKTDGVEMSKDELSLLQSSIIHLRSISLCSHMGLLFDNLPQKEMSLQQLTDWLSVPIMEYHIRAVSSSTAQKVKNILSKGIEGTKTLFKNLWREVEDAVTG